MEEVLPGWVSLTGWGGIVAAAVLAVFKGWLVPSRTVALIVGQLEARLGDRDALIVELRKANALQDARSDLLQSQMAHLVALVESNHAAIERFQCPQGDGPIKVVATVGPRVPGGGDPSGQALPPTGGGKTQVRKGTGRRRR